jgi:hypothetical protein
MNDSPLFAYPCAMLARLAPFCCIHHLKTG